MTNLVAIFPLLKGPSFWLASCVQIANDKDVLYNQICALRDKSPVEAIMSFAAILLTMAQCHTSEVPDWIGRAKQRLASQLSEECELPEVAKELGIGWETFRKSFREATGRGPGAYRLERRLEVAAHLLRETQLNCCEVAWKVGYADSFSFSKAFRKRHGVSPVNYRLRSSDPSSFLAAGSHPIKCHQSEP